MCGLEVEGKARYLLLSSKHDPIRGMPFPDMRELRSFSLSFGQETHRDDADAGMERGLGVQSVQEQCTTPARHIRPRYSLALSREPFHPEK